MLRSIADHARAQGEDLTALRVRFECLGVFAMGGRAATDDAAESGASRCAWRSRRRWRTQPSSSGHAPSPGSPSAARPPWCGSSGSSPSGSARASRRRRVAQAVPLVGALAGAAINSVFIQHYQKTAWGHFTVRRPSGRMERTRCGGRTRTRRPSAPGVERPEPLARACRGARLIVEERYGCSAEEGPPTSPAAAGAR